MLRPKNKFY
jgi:hypothetical protein